MQYKGTEIKIKEVLAGAIILAVAGSVLWHYVVYIPQRDEANRKRDIAELKMKQDFENDKIKKEEAKAFSKKLSLSLCLDEADEAYWDYIRLNGTKVKGEEDTWNAYSFQWEKAQKIKDSKEDSCFKQYK